MTRLLALEWNDSEARAAVASSRGDRVVFEQAFTIELKPALGEADAENGIGSQLVAALAARRVGRLDALVAVGRSSVELRQMSLPPVPDEELPELVRFQALREFGLLEEDWPLDYLPLDEDPAQARNVLAAAVSPRVVEEIRQGCETAGVKLLRLALRPASAASLVLRRPVESGAEVRLLVDLLPEEADLTVLIGHKLVFVRCARLSGDPLESAQALVSEIRLTMAASHNQLAGKRVEQIVLFGGGSQHAALARTIGEQLATPTVLFDPFDGVALDDELRRSLPEPRGRFASLLGMLESELAGQPQAFDFLHPRRRPEPPSRRNTYVLAGLAAGLLVLLALMFSWSQQSSERDAFRRLQDESKSLDKKVVQAGKLEKTAAEIDKWLGEEVVWLDEFRWLSEKFPSAEDSMLTQLKMGIGSDQAEMTLDGLARNVDAVTKLDRGLLDDRHRMAGKTKGEHEKGKSYNIQFRSSLIVTPRKP
jgi:Tfp pilus assembly PilM family ATPase